MHFYSRQKSELLPLVNHQCLVTIVLLILGAFTDYLRHFSDLYASKRSSLLLLSVSATFFEEKHEYMNDNKDLL